MCWFKQSSLCKKGVSVCEPTVNKGIEEGQLAPTTEELLRGDREKLSAIVFLL